MPNYRGRTPSNQDPAQSGEEPLIGQPPLPEDALPPLPEDTAGPADFGSPASPAAGGGRRPAATRPRAATGRGRRATASKKKAKAPAKARERAGQQKTKPGKSPLEGLLGPMTPLKRNILVAVGIFLLIVVILLVALLPSCSGGPLSSSEVESGMVTESGYDRTRNAIDPALFQGTILEETDDAGQEYIDDTLFLGDSNTVRFISYRDVTGVTSQNAIGVEGMGIQSVTSYRCVQFQGYSSLVTMPEAVKIIQPRRVVITFGTNNVGGMNVNSFIDHYVNALDAIRESYPYADIIIGSVIPVDQYHMNDSITMTRIDEYNKALAELAADQDVKFLNWGEAIRDANSGFAVSTMTISDGVHLSREGAEAMFNYYRTHAHISEDTRPKPLNTVPQRLNADVGLIASDITTPRSSTSSSSEAPTTTSTDQTVTVRFAVAGGVGGTISGYTTYSVDVAPGGSAPGVTATPAEGYRFVNWTCTAGSIADWQSPSLTFSVPAGTAVGDTITVTAVFERVEASSSEAPSSSSEPVIEPEPSVPPAEPSSEAPIETPSIPEPLLPEEPGEG